MKKKIFAISGAFSLIIAPFVGFAAPKEKPFELPANAVRVNDEVYKLGSAVDPLTGARVEGYAFIHRKNANAKPSGSGKPTGGCYAFLADGAKWKSVESWLVNPANTRGLDETSVFNVINEGVGEWEDGSDGTVGNNAGTNVMGAGTQTTATLTADASAPDDQNETYFGSIAENGVIAVTTVWGIFGGPTRNRQLVEWDMVIDQGDYDWSLTGEAGKMDLDNIVTHEVGHAFGMDHPASTCVDETMYAYADNGETSKRDLNTGDVAGINKMY